MMAAAALLVMAVMPAKADPAACDAIQKGFNAVASVPGYRQIWKSPGPASGSKASSSRDRLYARQ